MPIYFVSFPDAKEDSLKVGEDSKGLFVGRWGYREKASFSEMGYCLFKQKKRKALEIDILTLLIRLPFANGFGILLRKGMFFGEKLFVVNLGNWKGLVL